MDRNFHDHQFKFYSFHLHANTNIFNGSLIKNKKKKETQ